MVLLYPKIAKSLSRQALPPSTLAQAGSTNWILRQLKTVGYPTRILTIKGGEGFRNHPQYAIITWEDIYIYMSKQLRKKYGVCRVSKFGRDLDHLNEGMNMIN